jgi:phytanoyl-CoA hydroxylase
MLEMASLSSYAKLSYRGCDPMNWAIPSTSKHASFWTKLKTMVRRPPSGDGLWIDAPDAEQQVFRRTEEPFVRKHTLDVICDGATRIPEAVDPSLCDRVMADFRRYCDAHEESREYRDEHGYHSRLTNFHLECSPALCIGLNPNVLRLLDFFFGRRTAVCSSLVFEKGSQQNVHRDAPFFHTRPEGHFFGVWTALEDVVPDAGPLTYYVGGHKLKIDQCALADANPGKSSGELFGIYTTAVLAQCKTAGLEISSPTMRKGDTLIWHPQLPHGGTPIKNPILTRNSIVFHYLPEGIPIRGIEVFFSRSQPTSLPRYRVADGRKMIEHGKARFEHNY